MLGYSGQEGKLEFHHAVSYLSLNIKASDSTPFKSISVSGNLAESMSGEFVADFNTLTLSNDDKDASTISVIGDAEGIASNAVVMVAIPARTYTEGISVTLKDMKGQTRILKSSVSFPAVAGTVYHTELAIETGKISIDGLKDMPVIPLDPSIWD